MLRYYTRHTSGGDIDEVKSPKNGDDMLAYASGVTRADVASLVSLYDLDQNIVDDVFDKDELPRIEFDDNDNLYMFLRIPSSNRLGRVETEPLLAIATQNSLILCSHGDMVSSRYSTPAQLLSNIAKTPLAVLLGLFAGVIDEYQQVIDGTSVKIEKITRRLQKHEATNEDFMSFVLIEANLTNCTHTLDSLNSASSHMYTNSHKRLGDRDLEELDDIMLCIEQLLAKASASRSMVHSIRDTYSIVANNRLNHRMKILTIVTLLVTIPNVFYGMYGMNVKLPFQESAFAYVGIMAVTFLVVLVIFWMIRRSKIL